MESRRNGEEEQLICEVLQKTTREALDIYPLSLLHSDLVESLDVAERSKVAVEDPSASLTLSKTEECVKEENTMDLRVM